MGGGRLARLRGFEFLIFATLFVLIALCINVSPLILDGQQ